jgi:hypothetical protein
MYTTILTLYKQGKSQREIAKLTGRNRKTIFINLISMLLKAGYLEDWKFNGYLERFCTRFSYWSDF